MLNTRLQCSILTVNLSVDTLYCHKQPIFQRLRFDVEDKDYKNMNYHLYVKRFSRHFKRNEKLNNAVETNMTDFDKYGKHLDK